MCIGDWRLGRLIRTQARAFTLGAGGTLAISTDPNRVGISFFDTNIGTAGTLYTVNIDGAIIMGMPAGNPPIHITLATHGDLPTRAMVITRQAGTCVGGVIEYFAPAEYLAAMLQAFDTEYGKFLGRIG